MRWPNCPVHGNGVGEFCLGASRGVFRIVDNSQEETWGRVGPRRPMGAAGGRIVRRSGIRPLHRSPPDGPSSEPKNSPIYLHAWGTGMVTQNIRISPAWSTLVAKSGYVTLMAHPTPAMGIEHREQPKSTMSFTLLREEARVMTQLAMIVFAASVALIGLVGCGGDNGGQQGSGPAVAFSTGTMTGGQVVPAPGVSTTATGNFTGVIAENQLSIGFQLDYQGLTSEITAATIQLARPVGSLSARQVNGQTALYLCAVPDFPRAGATVPADTPNRVPAGTAECSGQSNNVTGTLVASNVQANTAAQLVGSATATSGAAVTVGAGDLALVLREIKAGNAYVLVRSKNFPASEIRGQIPAQP